MTENKLDMVDDNQHIHGIRCISWSAVIMGALIIVGLSFLFNLLSFAVGLSAFSFTNGKVAFAVSGFTILAAISIITMFIGGWITGYLGRAQCLKRYFGELYGFAAWSLALIATVILASQFGRFVSNYSYMVGRDISSIQIAANEVTAATVPNAGRASTADNAAALGTLGFATFFLFGIGALSACFGGRYGITFRRARNSYDEHVLSAHTKRRDKQI